MTSDLAMHEGSQLWARLFPRVYDPTLWLGERRKVRALRKMVLRPARGRTVEIGAGTGLNLPHYPAGSVDELLLVEPDPGMLARLQRRAARSGHPARAVQAPAERLPFDDASVDTVVSTFVLCTVEDPDQALREIARVLRPDGQFLFLEHVRSDSARLAHWQDRLAEPWRRFGRGCRCNRATAARIAANGFELADVHNDTWPAMPPIIRPLVAGRAERRADPEERRAPRSEGRAGSRTHPSG